MRKHILIIATLISIMQAACNSGNPEKRQQKLKELKAKEADIKQQIEALEHELGSSDSASAVRGKMVVVTEMKEQPFIHYVEVQGAVSGDQDVIVSAQAMGSVTSVLVKTGDKIIRGQLMATIDDRIIRQSMESVQVQYNLAKTIYDRQKNLWDQQIGSEIQFLNAKTQKESLEKQLAALQDQLDLTRIKSPIDGTVDQVNVKAGQTVSPGIPVFRVVNLEELKVKAEVAESHINTVKQGNQVTLIFPDMNKEIQTRLDYSGKAINTLNRSFNVEVHLKKSDGVFYPNQVVVVKIADYHNNSAFVIPVSAVQKTGDGEFVFISEPAGNKTYTARHKKIITGRSYNGKVEVLSGITNGDLIITFGNQNLVEGDLINF
ncbi:MAG: efflux RND transporter periplasmic adaptor subunit [Bacteroidia bacterium]|nr:efflux RND transporter periplasmic adaptor subunit [Bacteroidia bacterium]MCZ2277716.1 efflux RND transporter periplasmic adaptor subunit [Bacteroidia bacterium]